MHPTLSMMMVNSRIDELQAEMRRAGAAHRRARARRLALGRKWLRRGHVTRPRKGGPAIA
ncbi:MAG: hypothetical protein ACRDMJ_19650 [Solirubrobacteraceae bacterium]